jgi:dihydroorotate dehydrogenase
LETADCWPALNPLNIETLYSFATRALRCLDPETAHRLAIRSLEAGIVPEAKPLPGNLRTVVWGRQFAQPLGVAAGFDKDAEVMAPLLRAGAGFVEIGAVTPQPQPGNPKPRVFRLPEDGAVINRYGFNSAGHSVAHERMAAFRRYSRLGNGVVGVNLGMNKDETDPPAAYRAGVEQFAAVADFLTINVSSPNTPGLRDQQQEGLLSAIVDAAREALDMASHRPSLLVKLSPDLSDDAVDALVSRLSEEGKVDGWIVSNTTIARPESLRSSAAAQAGGLSGQPLRDRSTELVARVYKASGGAPIIGAGGVDSGQAAYEKIRAGASLVQVYTSLIFNGPLHLRRIAQELSDCLTADGIPSVQAAVGSDHC